MTASAHRSLDNTRLLPTLEYRVPPIRQYPDMALRWVARTVGDDDLAYANALAGRMCQIVEETGALGLAAPQLGCALNIFAFRRDDETVVAAINPTIENAGVERVALEGCLSLGLLQLPVSRQQTTLLQAFDTNGEEYVYEASGLWARVLQHEYDHLQGRLILDITTNPALLVGLAHDRLGLLAAPLSSRLSAAG